ncbi:MAG TPA: hypothetical protein VGC90_00765 [Candidatus Limnocylindrales bacterium]|jgi:hypothetical protein
MDWDDQPTEPNAPVTGQPTVTPTGRGLGGIRRGLITGVLSAGLLIAGVAAVNAASPDPSASAAPGASQPSGGGTAPSVRPRGGAGHLCPGGGSGGGAAPGSGSTNPTPGSSAGASGSDA